MATLRLLFNRNTILGDVVALQGEIHSVGLSLGRELLALNRAVLAPDEPELPPPGPLTTEIFSVEPEVKVSIPKGKK